MYTQCPLCQTIFEIEQSDLDAAGGKVRCGSCNHAFHANEHLIDTLPEHPAAEPLPQFEIETTTEAIAVEQAEPTVEATPTEMPQAEIPDEEFSRVLAETTLNPEQVEAAAAQRKTQARNRRGPFATLLWSLGSLLLLTVMLLQTGYALHEQLADRAELRPWLEMICDYADCDLPERRDPNMIEVVEREVRALPAQPNALLITARLENKADFSQPFPVMRLSMTDINNKVVAARDFTPEEYLSGNTDIDGGMAPNAPALVRLEVVDPGNNAAGFKIDPL